MFYYMIIKKFINVFYNEKDELYHIKEDKLENIREINNKKNNFNGSLE